MKSYTCVEVTSNWMGTAKSLAESVEHVLNEKTLEGYELVSIGYTRNGFSQPIAMIIFSK